MNMDATLTKRIVTATLGIILSGGMVLDGHSEPATTNSLVVTESIPQSVFENSLASGKDPFFPNSRRRVVDTTPTSTNTKPSTDVTSLFLQGLSHAAGRPLATINNQTFRPGESGEVVTPSGRIQIRCEEIRADSVLITVSGNQVLELRLPNR